MKSLGTAMSDRSGAPSSAPTIAKLHQETWVLVTWVSLACYLHARSTAGWKGTRAAVITIIGLASFWFNFIGANLLVSGLHTYAGV